MRRVSVFFLAILSACALVAPLQARAQSPMLVVKDGAEKSATQVATQPAANPVPGTGFPNFPEAAITRVGENTTGQHVDAPSAPATPAAPVNPANAPAPSQPPNPKSPSAPTNAVSKLWPKDTVQIFMPACVGFHREFIKPCLCVISKLMVVMPHDEFLTKSENGTIEQDARLTRIRTECATAPQRKE